MKRYPETITHDIDTRAAPIRLDVRYLRIPVTWSVEEIPNADVGLAEQSRTGRPLEAPYFREKFLGFEEGWARTDVRGVKVPTRISPDGRYALVPEVNQSRKWEVAERDPFDLRTQFLKLNIDDQDETLDFLNGIGVWNINTQTGEESMRIERIVGHRFVSGFASVFSVADLKDAQKRLRHQMEWLAKDRSRLRSEFRKLERQANNPLKLPPLHFEWGGEPKAVIQAVTGYEMLNVTLQFDLLSGTGVYVCEKCMTRFSSDRKVRYCSDRCRKASAQKALRDRQREQKITGRKWRKTL